MKFGRLGRVYFTDFAVMPTKMNGWMPGDSRTFAQGDFCREGFV
ncbi:hypothetical protein [Azospirillum palustre]